MFIYDVARIIINQHQGWAGDKISVKQCMVDRTIQQASPLVHYNFMCHIFLSSCAALLYFTIRNKDPSFIYIACRQMSCTTARCSDQCLYLDNKSIISILNSMQCPNLLFRAIVNRNHFSFQLAACIMINKSIGTTKRTRFKSPWHYVYSIYIR